MKGAIAEAERSGAEVSVRYKPFMIDPGTKASGEDYTAYCRRRWGGDGWTYSLRDRGKQLGLKFGKWTYWPNTLNAHRVCAYLDQLDAGNVSLGVKEKEVRALDLMNKLYELTYERGANISVPEGAAAAVEELGFARACDVIAWLANGGGTQEVEVADNFAKREMDIQGVPFFVISGDDEGKQPVALSGAQSSSAICKAIRQVM